MYRMVQRSDAVSTWPCPENMPSLIHGLLMRRGVSSPEEADAFLHPSPDQLHDPMLLSGMGEAVSRILRAAEAGEQVCVFGDYDVDGVSASSLLSLYLRSLGLATEVYIPSRHAEGYGLNEHAVREIAGSASLLITVDCGISCQKEVALAQELGMDVIVTDHHRPGETLPECTVVNPLLNEYPCPGLCGTGVAFKLVLALCAARQSRKENGAFPSGWEAAKEYVDLAALATVADVVPLTGENRVIVSLGLRRINEAPRPGVEALIHAAGLDGKPITAMNVAFQLAPRLNASGRLGDARRAMSLLIAENRLAADPIAAELEEENTARRAEEQKIVQEAFRQMEEYDLTEHRIIVLTGEGWNPGVIGLAASRLVTKYHYPVILLAARDGVCTGSCRSIPGVDIFAALSSCAYLMTRFGGHRQAAGLTIDQDRAGELLSRLDEYLRENVAPEEYIPELEYDLALPLAEVSEQAVRQMELLQPTGFGNPSPVLLGEVAVDSARAVGRDGAHLQMTLSDGGHSLSAICFGEGRLAGELSGERRRMLYAPQINVWRDRVSVQCDVKSILEADIEEVFARFAEKYPRYLRTYLTEVLYNIELNSPIQPARPLERAALAVCLRESPQGTAIAVATRSGAEGLMAFLREQALTARVDGCAGKWGGDQRAFNCVSFCPAGEAPQGRYERVVLWDLPPEAFRALPEGSLYRMDQTCAEDWPGSLPGVDRLREIYVAARRMATGGALVRMTGEEIDRALARAADAPESQAMAALAVLRNMELMSPERERLELLPPRKSDPAANPLFRRLQLIFEYSNGKG